MVCRSLTTAARHRSGGPFAQCQASVLWGSLAACRSSFSPNVAARAMASNDTNVPSMSTAKNGSPFETYEIDMDKIDEKNPQYTYTEEEAKARYGPNEGREFGDDVQICGTKLPKARAFKFATKCGTKVGQAFMKLSNEERHAVMSGVGKFPEAFMRESLSEYYIGSNGKHCDSCQVEPQGEQTFEACSRCKFTVCEECSAHRKLGTCYCRDENFGVPYPAVSRRKFYQKGIW